MACAGMLCVNPVGSGMSSGCMLAVQFFWQSTPLDPPIVYFGRAQHNCQPSKDAAESQHMAAGGVSCEAVPFAYGVFNRLHAPS